MHHEKQQIYCDLFVLLKFYGYFFIFCTVTYFNCGGLWNVCTTNTILTATTILLHYIMKDYAFR